MRKQQEQEDEGTELARRAARQWLAEAELIPISYLDLDAAEPIGGWLSFFAERGVEVVEDDLYRPSVRREDVRRILDERRQQEEKAPRRDSPGGPPLPAGVPALEGEASPMQSLVGHDPGYQTPAEEFGQRPRPNFLAEELEAGQRQQAAARAEAEAKAKARGEDR